MLADKYPSVVDRYFTRRYSIRDDGAHLCVLYHSNKICVVTLAESHTLFRNGAAVEQVNFKISEKLDRTQNQVQGKGKKGAQHIDENSILCTVRCSDGNEHVIRAGVRGKLVEINERLSQQPSLIVDNLETNRYIAVILQPLSKSSKPENNHISQEDYEKLISTNPCV